MFNLKCIGVIFFLLTGGISEALSQTNYYNFCEGKWDGISRLKVLGKDTVDFTYLNNGAKATIDLIFLGSMELQLILFDESYESNYRIEGDYMIIGNVKYNILQFDSQELSISKDIGLALIIYNLRKAD